MVACNATPARHLWYVNNITPFPRNVRLGRLWYHQCYLCQISHANHAILCLYYYAHKVCNFHMWVFQINLKYHCSKPIKLQKFLMYWYNIRNVLLFQRSQKRHCYQFHWDTLFHEWFWSRSINSRVGFYWGAEWLYTPIKPSRSCIKYYLFHRSKL